MSEPNIQLAGKHLKKTAQFFFATYFCGAILTTLPFLPLNDKALVLSYACGIFLTILFSILAFINLLMAGEDLETGKKR
jgi:hypothetical protein